jgi:hypothetical protein
MQENIFLIPPRLPALARFQNAQAWSELDARAGSHSFLTSGTSQLSLAALAGERRLRK